MSAFEVLPVKFNANLRTCQFMTSRLVFLEFSTFACLFGRIAQCHGVFLFLVLVLQNQYSYKEDFIQFHKCLSFFTHFSSAGECEFCTAHFKNRGLIR